MIERIVLVGMMGAGKSATGAVVASRLRLPFFDLDRRIEEEEGRSIAAIFVSDGEAAFRRIESLHVSIICREPRGVLAAGGGAILTPSNRTRLRSWGRTVYLRARPETLAARLAGSGPGERPLLEGGDPVGRLAALLASRSSFYEEADLVLDTDGLSAVEAADLLLRGLEDSL